MLHRNLPKKVKWQNFIALTLAGIINAFGIISFLSPVKLYDSGISGTSMLLAQVTPSYLTLSIFLIILNIPLFLFGLKREGKVFTIYATYSVFIYSIFAWIFNNYLQQGLSSSIFAGNDLMLCALFGGLLSGIGSGLAIKFGGAMDGIDVLAVIFAKRVGISVGTFVMIYNSVLYVLCGIILSSWILPLYSIIAYAVALKAVDYIVDGFDHSKAAFIVTDKAEKVSASLSEEFESGITLLDAKGYYSNSSKTVIYFVVNRFQVGRMKDVVHEADPYAYISICEIADIVGANVSA